MKNKVVGLVDDENVFHWIIEKYVEKLKEPCDFLSFYNGDEIYEYLTSSPKTIPDILLLDLNMPVCNGWIFLENYEKIDNDIKKLIDIYIVSSSIDPQDKKKAESFSAVKNFISKPIPHHFLEEALNKVSAG